MRWLVLFALGCGRIEFDPSDATAIDAAPVTCWPAWAGSLPALEPPTLITELDPLGKEHDMTQTLDGLQLYFSSDRTGGFGGDDVWLATRADRSSPWSTIEHVTSLSSAQDEGVFFTRDCLSGWISGEFIGGEGLSDIWFAERTALDQDFTVAQAGTEEINGGGADYDAWVSVDGLRIYYSSQQQLQVSSRMTSIAAWGTPVTIAELNTGGEWDPSLSDDERVVVFTSIRQSPPRDIYYATRASSTAPFGTAQSLSVLNTTASEYDPHVAPDGCAIYFSSDRGRSAGDLALYVARVIP